MYAGSGIKEFKLSFYRDGEVLTEIFTDSLRESKNIISREAIGPLKPTHFGIYLRLEDSGWLVVEFAEIVLVESEVSSAD